MIKQGLGITAVTRVFLWLCMLGEEASARCKKRKPPLQKLMAANTAGLDRLFANGPQRPTL
jgi:hypothetical protein